MNEALAVKQEENLSNASVLQQYKSQAEMYWKSGLCPDKFKNPEQIVITAIHGRALGIPFSIAVVEIHVINGVPGLSAKMQLALVRERCKGVKIQMIEQSHAKVSFKFKRPEDDDYTVISYTWDELPAILKDKPTYKNHGVDLLTARCITRMTRTGFSDVLAGFGYDPQELWDVQTLKDANVDTVAKPAEGAIPKRDMGAVVVDPAMAPDKVKVVSQDQHGEVLDAVVIENVGTEEAPKEPVQETLLAYDQKAIKALIDTLNMMSDQNQVGLAYDKFRTQFQDDAATLMEGYSVMQKRIAALKQK